MSGKEILRDEILAYVAMTVMKAEEAQREFRKRSQRREPMEAHLFTEAQTKLEKLRLVETYFPVKKRELSQASDKELREWLGLALQNAHRLVMRGASGMADSGELNSTSAMVRVFAMLRMQAAAELITDWEHRL